MCKYVYDYDKGKRLPERTFLINTLIREFDVEEGKSAETFAAIFLANMEFVGLTRTTPGGEWLTNDPDAARAGVTQPETDAGANEDGDEMPDDNLASYLVAA